MTVTLTFPPPTHPLSENEKRRMKHWAQWGRRLDPWKESVVWAWRMARDEHDVVKGIPCNFQMEIPFPTNARRDPHNYSNVIKAVVDALVVEGVWPDDNPDWITVLDPVLVKGDTVKVFLTPRSE